MCENAFLNFVCLGQIVWQALPRAAESVAPHGLVCSWVQRVCRWLDGDDSILDSHGCQAQCDWSISVILGSSITLAQADSIIYNIYCDSLLKSWGDYSFEHDKLELDSLNTQLNLQVFWPTTRFAVILLYHAWKAVKESQNMLGSVIPKGQLGPTETEEMAGSIDVAWLWSHYLSK